MLIRKEVNNKIIFFYGEEMVAFRKWFMEEPGAVFIKYCKTVVRRILLSLYSISGTIMLWR
jgi:hypothetical protein